MVTLTKIYQFLFLKISFILDIKHRYFNIFKVFLIRNFIGSCERIKENNRAIFIATNSYVWLVLCHVYLLWIFSKNHKKLFVLIMPNLTKWIPNKGVFDFTNLLKSWSRYYSQHGIFSQYLSLDCIQKHVLFEIYSMITWQKHRFCDAQNDLIWQ